MNTVVSYLLISFFITGFHGFHVLSGVIINIIIFFNVLVGTYEKEKLRNGRESWFVLALCRFSLGICFYSSI
jgi:heme/copper-type cytochrome/quinol oxidase subunit 3